MSTHHRDGRKEKRRRNDEDEEEGEKLPDVQIHDSGGEISMSIEETNKMRIALGLKPLNMESKASIADAKAVEAHKERKAAEAKAATADELREKIQRARDKRREENLLKTKTLGAKDEAEDDDVYAWVQKSRKITEEPRKEKDKDTSKDRRRDKHKRRKSRKHSSESEQDEDEEGSLKYSARDLMGMKVKHDYKDLDDGEMMVLTLADKSILDEKGDLLEAEDDELENVLKAEDKKRKKAREASQKRAKPLFEEDGKKRSLLDKYDEEEEDMIRLGDEATIEAKRQQVREEVRKKLAASAEKLESSTRANSDYYTHEEISTMFKKKKRKKGKQLRQKPQDEDDEAGGTAAILEALEAEAELQQAPKGSDLGKRGDRMTARERAAAEEAARVQERRQRFDNALDKANWAAQALRNHNQASNAEQDIEDEGDRELYESLARARRAAAREAASRTSKLEEIAEMVAKNRDEDEAKLKAQLNSQPGGGGLEFTETREFIHSIQPAAEEAIPKIAGSSKTPVAGLESVKMEVDEKPVVQVKAEDREAERKAAKTGKWVSAEHAGEEDDEDMMVDDVETKTKPPELQEAGLTGEKVIGRGLAACLDLLKEKGELKRKLEWAGRTNDKKKTQVMGLEDVYTGGMAEDRLALDIEVALTQRDEYGRILTPKERFRELSYRFHGKTPSKNKQEKKQKLAQEEIASRKAATSENPSQELEQMRQLQAKTGAAFVVLDGRDNNSNKKQPTSSKPPKPTSSNAKSTMKTPVLGGGYTPLTDPQRKVQAMYGIKPGASSDMPPPPRRPPPSS